MSDATWEALSNQAVAAAGVVYFLALLAHLVEWSSLRKVPVEPAAPVRVGPRPSTEAAGAVAVVDRRHSDAVGAGAVADRRCSAASASC